MSDKQLYFLPLLVFVSASLASAQTTSTEVLGTVSDATGAVVPNATITLLRVGTGEKRTAVTDTSGNYSFPLIEIGEYTGTAAGSGVKKGGKNRNIVGGEQKGPVQFPPQGGAAPPGG